ncbi:MAG: hypothetical protein AB9M60_10360 [Leptothrix sp. (in: b-proteobacteria)]
MNRDDELNAVISARAERRAERQTAPKPARIPTGDRRPHPADEGSS